MLRSREATMVLVGPLHWRSRAVALLEPEIVAHADLVAVAHDGCSGKREHRAVRELEVRALTQHGRQPAANAAVVQLHRLLRTELLEDQRALLLREAAEVELVVVAEEVHPLRRWRELLRRLERRLEWTDVLGRERVEEVLIHEEVEHHVNPV